MKKSLSALCALSLVSGALFVSDAATPPPSMHLQKGQWSYHSEVHITSGALAGRTIKKDWKVCVKDNQSAAKALMPHTKNGDTTCSKPTMSHDGHSYHTTMACTTKARGITSKLKEDFVLTPGAKGATFKAHGKVNQQLLIPSMAPRNMHMTMDINGKRIGTCPGA